MSDYSHITAVIFDMDGTLIEHTWGLSQITEAMYDRFADDLHPVSHDEFFEEFWGKSADMWFMMQDQAISGETAAKYAYFNTLRTLGLDTDLAEPMVAAWEGFVLEEAIPFEDTYDVLEALQGKYTTGILTNGFTALQRAKIERYRLAEYVDFTVVSEETGYHKPDPRVFEATLKLAGDPDPAQTLYIGDTPQADIQGALGVGITPILMNPKDDIEPRPSVKKIKALRELLTLLQV